MLLIKAQVKSSGIHGLGLFAEELVPKGTRVWQFSPSLDLELSWDDFDKLLAPEKEYILFFGFLSKKSGKYHLSFDNVKYINHSPDGNIVVDQSAVQEIEFPLMASKDIMPGEEITQNYKEFEESGHGL